MFSKHWKLNEFIIIYQTYWPHWLIYKYVPNLTNLWVDENLKKKCNSSQASFCLLQIFTSEKQRIFSFIAFNLIVGYWFGLEMFALKLPIKTELLSIFGNRSWSTVGNKYRLTRTHFRCFVLKSTNKINENPLKLMSIISLNGLNTQNPLTLWICT